MFFNILSNGLWSVTIVVGCAPAMKKRNLLSPKSTSRASRSSCGYRDSVGVVVLLASATILWFSSISPCVSTADIFRSGAHLHEWMLVGGGHSVGAGCLH